MATEGQQTNQEQAALMDPFSGAYAVTVPDAEEGGERRRLTMLNEAGDTTISWTEDRDDEMEKIIQRKMNEGVTFFVVERRGRPPKTPKRGAQLKDAADARKVRTVVIPDEDLAKFVSTGAGQVERASEAPVETSRVSRSAKEVARSRETVGVKPRRGG